MSKPLSKYQGSGAGVDFTDLNGRQARKLRDAAKKKRTGEKEPRVKNPEEYSEELRDVLSAKVLQALQEGDEQLTRLLHDRDAQLVLLSNSLSHRTAELENSRRALKIAEELLMELSRHIDWKSGAGAHLIKELPPSLLAQVLAIGEPLLLARTVQELTAVPKEPAEDNHSGFKLGPSVVDLAAPKMALAASVEAHRQGFIYKHMSSHMDQETSKLSVVVHLRGQPGSALDRTEFKRALYWHKPSVVDVNFSVVVELPL